MSHSKISYPLCTALLLSILLQACGGGGGGESTQPPPPPPPPPPAGTLQLGAATYSADESTKSVSFTVTRSGGTTGLVTVDISTSDGTAVAGQDYGAITTTASFSDGDSGPKTGTFIIFDDSDHEPDETVVLTLSNVTGGATIGSQSSAVVTIVNDDLATHTVGGSIAGLSGTGLVLRMNGGDDVPVGSSETQFRFPSPLTENTAYSVTVATQPWNPAQRCDVSNGDGVIASVDVTDIRIDCSDVPLQSMIVSRNAGGQSDIIAIREDGNAYAVLADTVDSENFQAFAGDRVVFVRSTANGGDVYSILPDGSSLQTLAGGIETESFGGIADSGGQVVFERRAGLTAATDDLYIIGADGGNLLPLAVTADDEEFAAVSASTTGERVIYSRTINTQYDLYSVNLDGTDSIAIADSGDFELLSAVTPGGRVIYQRLVGSQYDLYSVNADGTDTVELSATAVDDEFVTMLDGERLLYRREAAASQYDLYAINADGTGQATLADTTLSELYAGVTPSGRVVFTRVLSDHNDLFAVDDDGTGLSTLAATLFWESYAGTLSDGRIVYLRTDPTETSLTDIFLVNDDGSDTVQLTDTLDSEEVNASALQAGERLIFRRDSNGEDELFSMLLDGSDERQLSDTPNASVRAVALTTSGGVIYHVSDANGADLYRVAADGNGATLLGATVERETFITLF